jgi:predicted molibdopterin-dependent oxidoreductase YjgC
LKSAVGGTVLADDWIDVHTGGDLSFLTGVLIIFSPEIPGRCIGSARPEWRVFREVMRRAKAAAAQVAGMQDAYAIRREIAQTTPLYAGIDRLGAKGDQVQWGGRTLYADGRFATADGNAHFAVVTPRHDDRAPDGFVVSTRSGRPRKRSTCSKCRNCRKANRLICFKT